MVKGSPSANRVYSYSRNDLLQLSKDLHADYVSASPFPHIVIDNLFDNRILDAILGEFPSPKGTSWNQFNNQVEVKLAKSDEEGMGPATKTFLRELNSQEFVDFLEILTGISGLVPDPHYLGGGLHQIKRGGFLKIHSDFNYHSRLKLDRRLNLLVYLNKNWKESYGGHLELWDEKMRSCKKRVLPVFNRCVIFSTTDFSFHGHPDPLKCPESNTRKSLALYYYSNGRPKNEVSSARTTDFRRRPQERWDVSLNKVIIDLLPPFVVRSMRGFRR